MADFSENTDTETQQPDRLSPAAQIGAGLQQVRERLGWKLADIAAHIRIQPMFLSAIESGNLAVLPGAAYRSGFVRTYAQALGLDGEEILQRFRDVGQIDDLEKNEIKLLSPVPDRGVPTGVVIFIAFIVAIGGYGLWYHHTQQTRKLAQNVLQIPAKLQPLTTPPKVTPAVVVTPPKVTSPPMATVKTPAPITLKNPAVAPATSPASNGPPTSPPAPGTAPASPPASAPVDTGMVITATQPSWIQVTAPDGTILFSKVLNVGESWPVPKMAGLKITTGNAGGTVISTDGQAGQPLGTSGAVLHNYPLTPPAPTSNAAPGTSSPGTATAP